MQTIVPKISFITYSLGCRTNQAELEVISDQLSVIGFVHNSLNSNTQPLTPNLVLINTCIVTGKAERETRKAIRHFRKLYPDITIVVLGCAVTAKEKFKIDLPEADLLISNGEKDKAVGIILKYCSSLSTPLEINSVENYDMTTSRLVRHNAGLARRVGNTKNDMLLCNRITACHLSGSISSSKLITTYEESGRKFIKIQDGCSNRCSFCVTTHLRGEPRSEEADKIVNATNELTNSKIKEIILTGINIGLYGIDLKPQIDIWNLVDQILKETKIERLTLSTVYPEMLWDKGSDPVKGRTLMKSIGNARLTKCFHLALQSGSPSVLRRMNRPTDLKKLLTVIEEIRRVQLDFTFRADVIAGFPDETEEEHQETLEFIRKARISFAHVFPYSPRIGTIAYEMIKKKKWKDLAMEVKRRRAREIRLLVGRLSSELSGGMVGKTYRVLVVREVGEKLEGISDNGQTVIINQKLKMKIKNDKLKVKNTTKGSFVEAKITGYKNGQLLGEILSLPI